MFVEFQLSGNSFTAFTRNFVESIPICTDQIISYSGEDLMIDRVTIPSNTTITQESFVFSINTNNGVQSIMGLRPIVRQEAKIRLVKVSDLHSNGTSQSSAFQNISVDVLVSLTVLFDSDDAPFLRVRFERLDFKSLSSSIPASVKSAAENLIRAHFNQTDRDIDTSSISDIVEGIDFEVTNAGVATDAENEVLYIRLEINGHQGQPNVLTSWEAFFNNSVTNRLGTREWAVLLDKNLLRQSIKQRIKNQLDGQSKFDLDSSVKVTWSFGMGAQFFVEFSGEVIDACICFFSEIDVDTDVFSTITLTLPQADLMRTNIYTTYDADDAEIFCCALTAGLFWPVVGIIYMADEDNPVNFGHYLLGIAFAFWIPMIGVAIGAGQESTTKYMKDVQDGCEKLSDEELRCEQELTLNFSDVAGSFTANKLTALPEGPLLSGSVDSVPDFVWGSFNLSAWEFRWTAGGNCRTGFSIGQSGGFMLQGLGPMVLCTYRVLNDPLNVFSEITEEDLGAGATQYTVVPWPTPAYLQNPYPCQILIVTNVGVRIVTLGIPTVLSEEEQDQLAQQAVLMEGSCPKMVKIYPWQFLKEWLPDPPPDEVFWAEIWQVVVTEMNEFEQATLGDEAGQTWAEGVATRNGVAHLSAFRENQTRKSKMIVTLNASAEGQRLLKQAGKDGVERFVFVKQIQLLPITTIDLRGEFESFSLDREEDGYELRVLTTKGTARYQLSGYAKHGVVNSVQRRNLEASERVTQFDDFKLYAQGRNAEVRVDMYDDRKRGTLVVSRRTKELTIADLMSRQETISLPVDTSSVEHVQFIRYYGLKNALYVQATKQEGVVYDLSKEARTRKLAVYHHRPWFDRTIRIDKIYARLNDEKNAIQLYRIGAIREE